MGRGAQALLTVRDENGIYRSLARERRNQRRKQMGVGLAGLAALGGAGFFVVQSQLIDLSRTTATREPRIVAPLASRTPTSPEPASTAPPGSVSAASPGSVSDVSPGSASTVSPGSVSDVSPGPALAESPRSALAVSPGPALAVSPGPVSRSGARQQASPTPSPTPPSPSASPPSPSPSTGLAAASSLNEHSETTDSGRIRVTSAGYDLTGRPELAIAGDTGWLVGSARCTKTVRTASGDHARVVPSMLVCWRTSPRRSVVTVAVAEQGRPSSVDSVAAIRREWARLS